MTEALPNDGELPLVEDLGEVASRPPPCPPEKVENENMVDPLADDCFWVVMGTAVSSVFGPGTQWTSFVTIRREARVYARTRTKRWRASRGRSKTGL